MPRRRKDHRKAADIAFRVIRSKQRATWSDDIKPAMQRHNLVPSTFALWNLRNAGLIKRVAKGTYAVKGTTHG